MGGGAGGGGVLSTPALVPQAVAQQAPALLYTQPLAPAAVTAVQEKLRQAGTYTGRADRRLGAGQPGGAGAVPDDAWAGGLDAA